MARKRLKAYLVLLSLFAVIGLIVRLLTRRRDQNQQAQLIIQTLMSKGMDLQTARQWVTVAALETNGFTSQVYKDSHNLFGLRRADKPALGYGEHQNIFPNDLDSINALFEWVIKYWNYPLNFSSIQDQAEFMKSKWYYGGDIPTYVKNMVYWWNKLFL